MNPLSVVVIALALVLLSAHAALAYVDPGVGSMALQVILAGFAGLAVILRLLWRRLMGRLGIGDARKTDLDAADESEN